MKIGIDLGGSHIAMGVVDENFNIIETNEKRLLNDDKLDIKRTIENYIVENVEKFQKKYEISEIGISAAGAIENNIIKKSVNLGVEDYNIINNLKVKIDLPIKIKNDAKCAALAESKIGCLKNYKSAIFLTLGTGIGGAAIIDGNLLNTGNYSGCEFGHMIIERNGRTCNCGKKGCFEKYASMKDFKKYLKIALNLDELTRGEELLNLIRTNKKDETINRVIDEFIDYLSIGISNLVNVFEPEIVGIGGSFVYFSDIFLEKLQKNIIEKNYLFNKREELKIVPAMLKNNAGIIGAVV